MVAIVQPDLMLDPSRWPCFPILPLEHKREREHGFPKLGVMLAEQECELIVFLCNMFDLPRPEAAWMFPSIRYSSLEALQHDWQVA